VPAEMVRERERSRGREDQSVTNLNQLQPAVHFLLCLSRIFKRDLCLVHLLIVF
jgi:hypothetical protein